MRDTSLYGGAHRCWNMYWDQVERRLDTSLLWAASWNQLGGSFLLELVVRSILELTQKKSHLESVPLSSTDSPKQQT